MAEVIPITVARAAREFAGKVIDSVLPIAPTDDASLVASYVADLHASRACCAGTETDTGELIWVRGILDEAQSWSRRDFVDLLRALDEEIAKRVGRAGA